MIKKKKHIGLQVGDVCELLGVCSVGPAVIVVLLAHEVDLLIVNRNKVGDTLAQILISCFVLLTRFDLDDLKTRRLVSKSFQFKLETHLLKFRSLISKAD